MHGSVRSLQLGLGYLTLDRATPTSHPASCSDFGWPPSRYHLFGVVYVLDEPSAGLHPADTEALLAALDQLVAPGNTVFVVEHEVDVIRHADWIVDIGPAAGVHGGEIVYSGPLDGLAAVRRSVTARYLFGEKSTAQPHAPRAPRGWLALEGDRSQQPAMASTPKFPLGVFTTVTGVSGSGKSTLVSQVLVELVLAALASRKPPQERTPSRSSRAVTPLTRGGRARAAPSASGGWCASIRSRSGRTPRSNLATYTGLFDAVRKLFAATPAARARRYDAGRFFNVAKGRCETCEGEGFVSVELIFLPQCVSRRAPRAMARATTPKTLEILYRSKNIAEVLALTVDDACEFFPEDPLVLRPLEVLREVGVGYLRLGQPATELSGGEAQRVKLATELQRVQRATRCTCSTNPRRACIPMTCRNC